MKSKIAVKQLKDDIVASFAEAWIEITVTKQAESELFVASFAEAWIEIRRMERRSRSYYVASFAEAWIEIV